VNPCKRPEVNHACNHLIQNGTPRYPHDVHVAVAKFCSENLRQEVKKGIREKAEQGIYPTHAAFGYQNNRITQAIDIVAKLYGLGIVAETSFE